MSCSNVLESVCRGCVCVCVCVGLMEGSHLSMHLPSPLSSIREGVLLNQLLSSRKWSAGATAPHDLQFLQNTSNAATAERFTPKIVNWCLLFTAGYALRCSRCLYQPTAPHLTLGHKLFNRIGSDHKTRRSFNEFQLKIYFTGAPNSFSFFHSNYLRFINYRKIL